MTNIFCNFEYTMCDIHCSRCLDYSIWPCNELQGLSDEDWYFRRTSCSAANIIQNIVWVENITLKYITLRENWVGFNPNTFNVNFRFPWRDKIFSLVCLWSVTLITIMENIWNAEVWYNQIAVSYIQCINITNYSVRSVKNIKSIPHKFLWPMLYHGNTPIIFDNFFYCRTITKPIKEAPQ